ncbi:MAG: precorrin-3B C(17)-methyltransferase [Thiotrichaceae bacterium]|nr:precorrin-3B C(17)-methyltransferase [Thiotrichaceae bacterium]
MNENDIKNSVPKKAGKIYLVGFGPGSREHMTQRALDAISESDVVIGYSTYIQLVKDLLVGKQIVRKGMTEEIDRCVEAYEQAKQGKTVALVSSGDIGIYGMAGPTYEVLLQSGWTPQSDISVEVVPGSTALSACAALVGAPLTHDFCSISLSDLLTPWPTIARRVESAAKGDFVVALYNPKSGRRTGQIIEAQKILLRYRAPTTPVAIVKSAYRRKQKIEQTTLDKMSECDIGMLSTVLVGNSTTFVQNDLMITPRGYANKYQNITGDTHEGEKAGHSLNMGLSSWQECMLEYARQHSELSFSELATYFITTEAQVYEAWQMSAEPINNKSVMQAADTNGVELAIEHIMKSNKFTLIVYNHGVELRVTVQNSDIMVNKGVIRIKNEQITMNIERHTIEQIWLVEDQAKQFVFTDFEGRTLFSVLL